MKRFYLCLILFLFELVAPANFIYAQEPCAADILHQKMIKNDPGYAKRMIAQERSLQEKIVEFAKSRSSFNFDTIPVVVHVLHTGQAVGNGYNISDAQIQSAIDRLNVVYADYDGNGTDSEIRFALARRDPTGCTASNGINRINASGVLNYENVGMPTTTARVQLFNLSRWNTEEYLNIWVVSEIDNNNGGAGIQGFATFPATSHQYDGVVCMYNTTGYDPSGGLGYTLKASARQNEVVIHEVGHYLNLFHTFQGDDPNGDGIPDICPTDNYCGNSGDCCMDTDVHQRTNSNYCIDFAINECTGGLYGEVLHNYMAYSSEYCKDRFTLDQVGRMQTTLLTSRTRLMSSPGLDEIVVTEPPSACIAQTQATGMSVNYAIGIININFGHWATASGTSFEDGGYLDNWCNTIYTQPNSFEAFVVETAGGNAESLRIWIDYNNDGTFQNTTELAFASASNAILHGGFFNTPETVLYNTPLRIRFRSSPFSNSNSACFQPTYGQAEDYTIIFTSDAALAASVTELSNLSGLSCCASDSKSFTLEGSELLEDVSLALDNTNFELSLNDQNFSNSLLLTEVDSTIENQPVTIYVRLKAELPEGIYNDTLTISSYPAEDVVLPISGAVKDPDGFRGNAFTTPVPGNQNSYLQAQNFKGITGSGPRTYEAWIKTTLTRPPLFYNGFNMIGKKWTTRLDGGRLRTEIASSYITSDKIINDGEWHHIAVVLEDVPGATLNNIQFYIDGKIAGIADSHNLSLQVNTSNDQNLRIGRSNNSDPFEGSIDEVKIWSVARTQSQIRESMHLTLQGNETGLEAYYQFNEDAGAGTAKDAVNGHELNVNGAATFAPSTVDVGFGTCSTILVSDSGSGDLEINSNNLAIDFTDGGQAPDGDVVIYHIQDQTANSPSTSYEGSHHWVVRNFGGNTSDLAIESVKMTLPIADPVLNYTPGTMSLYKRGSASDGAWTIVGSTASSADPGTGEIHFTDLQNFTSFSQLAVGSNGTALPVVFNALTAKRTEKEMVALNWSTSSERNNSHFEIQQSYDGVIFNRVGQVKGVGESSVTTGYHFELIESKAAYYRLKQLDQNGQFILTDVRFVPAYIQHNTFTIFPNPTNKAFRISSSLAPSDIIEMQIVNINGSTVLEINGELAELNDSIARNFEKFRDGVYIIRLKHGFEIMAERLIINRTR